VRVDLAGLLTHSKRGFPGKILGQCVLINLTWGHSFTSMQAKLSIISRQAHPFKAKPKQDRQCIYKRNIEARSRNQLPWKSNKYYIF
jgi:hypothetical protein